MTLRVLLQAALAAALASPLWAQPVGRAAGEVKAVTPVPSVGGSLAGSGASLSAPSLALPGALSAPLLPSPALPTASVGPAASARHVPLPQRGEGAQAALAAPQSAAAAVKPGLILPGATPAEDAPALLGPDGRPLRAAQGLENAAAPGRGAQGQGRAAPGTPSLDALFDGTGGLPLDVSRDGASFDSTLRVGAAPTPAATLQAVKDELRRGAAAAQAVAAEAASARTFQGRAMSLDDPCCGVAAPVMGVLMRRAGLPVDAVQAEFHTFLTRRAGDEVFVVDPTIRQFFGGRNAPASVPQVFVGTLGELEALFSAHQRAKTTRYDVSRIYRSEAVVKNSLLAEAEQLAAWAAGPQKLLSPSEAVERDTYRGLGRALGKPSAAANPAKASEPAAPAAAEAPRPWWTAVKEFFSPTPAPDAAWDAVAAALGPELERLAALSKEERPRYLREVGDEIVARLKARHKTEEIGFHYNLHGGRPEQYVEAGGIRATMGDIALQYSMHGDRSYKVYFFRSSQHSLYELLSERHPNLVSSRMGDVLMLFKVDGFIKRSLESGVARNLGAISVDFDETKLPRMIGVPKEDFLGAPLSVFSGTAKRLGRKLSRDEETLAVMRYIEAALGSDPTPEGTTVRVGRARVDTAAPLAKLVLRTVGDPNDRPVLGLLAAQTGELVNYAVLGDGQATGHRDLLPAGGDPRDYRGFSLWLRPDGEVVLKGSGGFPGPITPALERSIRRAAGLR